jgi:hypothetical protein
MSVQILPYSVTEFNKIPTFDEAERDFQLGQGEAFVLSTLRLLLFEHDLHNVFGIALIHQHFNLNDEEKLVEFDNHAAGWNLTSGDKPWFGGEVVPTSWRVLKDRGLMPYEFTFLPKGIDSEFNLEYEKYQPPFKPFLKDFVDAVEAAQLHNSVGLTLRPHQPGHVEDAHEQCSVYVSRGMVSTNSSGFKDC